MSLPNDAQKIDVAGSTVDFFKYTNEGVDVYQFDTSMCTPPDPMVNAMAGLRLLDENSALVMINHKSPGGLFPKIDAEFNYVIQDLDNGNVKVVFTRKDGAEATTDFASNTCNG